MAFAKAADYLGNCFKAIEAEKAALAGTVQQLKSENDQLKNTVMSKDDELKVATEHIRQLTNEIGDLKRKAAGNEESGAGQRMKMEEVLKNEPEEMEDNEAMLVDLQEIKQEASSDPEPEEDDYEADFSMVKNEDGLPAIKWEIDSEASTVVSSDDSDDWENDFN